MKIKELEDELNRTKIAQTNAKVQEFEKEPNRLLQGVSTRYDILWSPRWPTKNDFQVQKKVAAHLGDGDIWVLSIFFQKSNIGWPQQPPTEMVPIFNLIFYDSTNIFFI